MLESASIPRSIRIIVGFQFVDRTFTGDIGRGRFADMALHSFALSIGPPAVPDSPYVDEVCDCSQMATLTTFRMYATEIQIDEEIC